MIRPIIFSSRPSIRALLDGRKTQERRVLRPQPPEAPEPNCAPGNEPRHAAPYLDAYCGANPTVGNPRGMTRNWHWWQVDDRPGVRVTRAPCVPGDLLWVREACRAVEHEDGTDAVEYQADLACARIKSSMEAAEQWAALYHYGNAGPDRRTREGQKVNPIHMPRWASRLTLRVTDVRVQRVRDISEADAKAEGCGMRIGPAPFNNYRSGFELLWDSIHGPDAWYANPWVAAMTFSVIQQNVDEVTP